jgi:hypothetical protein
MCGSGGATPGPWIVQYRAVQDGKGGTGEYRIFTRNGGRESTIAKLPGWTARHDANAALIAYAPALAAENERLQSAVNAGQDYIASLEATKREQTAALIEADAENERMREALERIALDSHAADGYTAKDAIALGSIERAARAALEGGKQ